MKKLELEKRLEQRINNAVFEYGAGFGPSLIGLYLFGPFGIKNEEENNLIKFNFSKDSINTLIKTSETIEGIYHRNITPKIYKLVEILTGSEAYFPIKTEEIAHKLRVKPFEDIRKIVKKDFFNFKIDEIDNITLNSLSSDEKMACENRIVKFFYDKKHNFLFKFRFKKKDKVNEKYLIRYKNLSIKDSGQFLKFIEKVSMDSNDFWKTTVFNKYEKKYGVNLTNMMLGDYCGLTIIDLNQKRAEERMEFLVNSSKRLKYPGFNFVEKRFDDHRKKIKNKKPGGLHFTFVDKGQQNFPIEVQYLGIKSLIYDMFGPNAHAIYSLRGKKANRNL